MYLKQSVLEPAGLAELQNESIAHTEHVEGALRKKPIRVVRIIDRMNVGGPARHVVWLTGGLNPELFETVLITGTVPEGEGDMSYFAEAEGVRPRVVTQMSRELSIRDGFVVFRLVRELFKIKPDIIHTHKSKAGAVGRMAAAIYRIASRKSCRIIHTFHGHIFHSYYGQFKTRVFIAIERFLSRFCTDQIITISEQQKQDIVDRFKVSPASKTRVIPLGIEIDEISATGTGLRTELGLGKDDVLIGTVGRLCEVKNYNLFLEAAALLLKSNDGGTKRLHFVVVGDGHLRNQLQERASGLGIAERVTFTGFRQDATRIYSEMDVVALTSLNEGTPLTLIEGMAAGRPVAATEVGGVPDILGARVEERGECSIWEHGVSSPSGDAKAFADGLRFLIERGEIRQAMGEKGLSFVRNRLSRKRLLNDIENLYVGLLQVSK